MMKRSIGLGYRFMSSKSQNTKLVDTLAMVKAMEEKNVPLTQAEALTGVIINGLKSVMEKVEEDMTIYQEHQSNVVKEEITKIQTEIEKIRDDIVTVRAQERLHHVARVHQLEQDVIKNTSDLRRDFNQLKVDFEATKYQRAKYALFTLGTVTVAGLGMLCLM